MAGNLPRIELSEIFLTQGIQDTHFFNGRLLTAGDLETMQEASRKRDVRLGRAVGAGVVGGLEVKLVSDGSDGSPPVLAVSCGLAFNRLGQAVALPVDTEVALSEEKPVSAQDTSLFGVCQPPQTGGKPLPGKGAYLFVARPAQGLSGLAPRRGFGQAARVEGCDRALLQDGVRFRMVPFDMDTLDKLSASTRTQLKTLLSNVGNAGSAGLAARNKLRNWLAHACYGTEELSAWPVDPFPTRQDDFLKPARVSPYLTYGSIDQLEAQASVDACDVPLALICWTTGGIKWLDMWSVRRRLHSVPAGARCFPLLASDRRAAETEAMMQQFQEQVQDMLRQPGLNLTASVARDHFKYLPPTGLLPIAGEGLHKGFNYDVFFSGMTIRNPVFIEGAQLRPLLQEAVCYPPLDTAGPVFVWLYVVRENAQALLSSPQPSQGYMVFASGHMPYRGEAHYDVHHQNFGNFA